MGRNYPGLLGFVSDSGGLQLKFLNNPPLSVDPVSMSHTSNPEKFLQMSEEVQTLLSKRAVEIVHNPTAIPGFYSRLFLVPKKTGGMRPVFDLSILNTFLVIPHFKMETNRSIRGCICPGI